MLFWVFRMYHLAFKVLMRDLLIILLRIPCLWWFISVLLLLLRFCLSLNFSLSCISVWVSLCLSYLEFVELGFLYSCPSFGPFSAIISSNNIFAPLISLLLALPQCICWVFLLLSYRYLTLYLLHSFFFVFLRLDNFMFTDSFYSFKSAFESLWWIFLFLLRTFQLQNYLLGLFRYSIPIDTPIFYTFFSLLSSHLFIIWTSLRCLKFLCSMFVIWSFSGIVTVGFFSFEWAVFSFLFVFLVIFFVVKN